MNEKTRFPFRFYSNRNLLTFLCKRCLYDWYKSFNAAHGMIMSFVKFGVLATLGEIWGFALVQECIIEKDLVSSLERLYGGF